MPAQTILTVGAGGAFATIGAAIDAANAMGGNADIRIAAGTYVNDGGYLHDGINNVTIEGVGGKAVITDPSFNAGGKAAIVVGGQGIVLRNLDISGVTVPDANGAAVRYDGGSLLLDHVHFHGNQNGLLGAPDPTGTITIQDSEFDGNGTDTGRTHNLYIGDIASFTLSRSYVHDANVGHEVKSRAENNFITNNYILDNAGTSSYSIDLPNGGNAVIASNVIEQGANNGNHTIMAYGEEGGLHSGTSLVFSNNVVVNDDRGGAGPVWNSNGVAVGGSGNTVWNATDLGSTVDPASFRQLASRPTVDPTVPLGSATVTAGPGSTPTAAAAGGGGSGGGGVAAGAMEPTWRFFDTVHGTQFLTSSATERDGVLANRPELTFEGRGMNAVAPDPGDANVAPVFRFFDSATGTHFFTASSDERAGVVATRPDLVEEAANFAEHLRPQAGDTAVFRFFDSHTGEHFFTQSATERAGIVATRADLVDEGIAFYAPAAT